MHRFYIALEDWNPDSLVLRGAEAHHGRDVLRLQPGGRVVVFNGRGHEITAEIAKITRQKILLRKMHEARVPPLPCQITLAQAIPKGKNMDIDLRLIGSLQSDAVHLKAVLADYEHEHHGRPASVLMCIGPEGDFTPAELNLARSNGCRPITLGPIILRVETAAIYCLSVLSYELLGKPSGTQV